MPRCHSDVGRCAGARVPPQCHPRCHKGGSRRDSPDSGGRSGSKEDAGRGGSGSPNAGCPFTYRILRCPDRLGRFRGDRIFRADRRNLPAPSLLVDGPGAPALHDGISQHGRFFSGCVSSCQSFFGRLPLLSARTAQHDLDLGDLCGAPGLGSHFHAFAGGHGICDPWPRAGNVARPRVCPENALEMGGSCVLRNARGRDLLSDLLALHRPAHPRRIPGTPCGTLWSRGRRRDHAPLPGIEVSQDDSRSKRFALSVDTRRIRHRLPVDRPGERGSRRAPGGCGDIPGNPVPGPVDGI